LFTGLTRQTIDNMIMQEQAHVRLFAPGYLDEEMPGLDFLIDNADSLAAELRAATGNPATVRMQMPGTMIVGREEAIVTVRGFDLETDQDVFKTLDMVMLGSNLDGTQGGALIGRKLAKDLSLRPGDRFTVLLKSAPGALNSQRLTVKGVINTSHPDFDSRSVIISLEDARTLALASGKATEIALLADKMNKADELRARLKQDFPGYEWKTWQDDSRDLVELMKVKRIGSGMFIIVLALVALVAIMNTMTMAVHERSREIGALRAMGFTRSRILWLFLTEGLLIGLISAIIGIIIGGGVTYWTSKVGITFANYEDIDFGMAISSTMYPALTLKSVATTFIFGVLVGAVSSWRAAWYAAHGHVVRALREGML
jgi:putative ABC transport system permease protein